MTTTTKSDSNFGFTLIELLVVIAVISILVSLTAIASSKVLASARSSNESGALRMVLQAYLLAATDRNGQFIDGYSNNQDEIFTGPNGEDIEWPASGRYVWRLLPYLDNAMASLYVNDQKELLSQYAESENYSYIASVFPSFGLNSEWIGGDQRTTAMPALESRHLYGKYLSDIRHPSRQLVFASAKAPEGTDDGALNVHMEGYFEIKSPYFPSANDTWRWSTVDGEPSTTITGNSADHGNLSARHEGNVLTGQLDGSTGFVSINELADMRRWAPNANAVDWTPSIDP
jgi:prepilin-type N-terminal cleavage/methylation domain-containing protein|tara:strand:- start:326 stop:1189 length:864 start_codon:yes stop_codon:yes gene_type:complete